MSRVVKKFEGYINCQPVMTWQLEQTETGYVVVVNGKQVDKEEKIDLERGVWLLWYHMKSFIYFEDSVHMAIKGVSV